MCILMMEKNVKRRGAFHQEKAGSSFSTPERLQKP